MSKNHHLIIGIAVGVAAYWVYTNKIKAGAGA